MCVHANLPPFELFYSVTQWTVSLGDRDAQQSLIHLNICSEDGWRGWWLEMDKMQIGVKLVCRSPQNSFFHMWCLSEKTHIFIRFVFYSNQCFDFSTCSSSTTHLTFSFLSLSRGMSINCTAGKKTTHAHSPEQQFSFLCARLSHAYLSLLHSLYSSTAWTYCKHVIYLKKWTRLDILSLSLWK